MMGRRRDNDLFWAYAWRAGLVTGCWTVALIVLGGYVGCSSGFDVAPPADSGVDATDEPTEPYRAPPRGEDDPNDYAICRSNPSCHPAPWYKRL